jgi:hypothetical protein
MSHDPLVTDGTAPGVDRWDCPFCDSYSVSDLHIDGLGQLKRHIKAAHPSDYAVVMNAVEQTMTARNKIAAAAAAEYRASRRN